MNVSLRRSLASIGLLAAAIVTAPSSGRAQVGLNDVALGKTAFQSSLYAAGHDADKVVDGNTDGNYNNLSVNHTNADANAFWYVDLGGNFLINSITVWNRTDCCQERLNNFFVSILSEGTPNVGSKTAPTVWTMFETGGPPPNPDIFAVSPNTVGRYVKVQFSDLTGQQYLHLAEVDVEGVSVLDVTSTPEPASIALMATGLVGVAGFARRRNRQR